MLAVLSFNGADEVVFSACRLATLRLFRPISLKEFLQA